ncbi:MAG: Protein MoaF [Pseudomonas citronellolis]|nr:MAG: Protein MoaF [Pseudomonas citronellolis]
MSSPTTPWISVGDLADGFAPQAFTLPASAALAGQRHVLHFANGWVIEHDFDAETLRWTARDGHSSGSAEYRASSIRDGILLVDFLKREGGQLWSVSLVLDLSAQAFSAVLGRLPDARDVERSLYARALAGDELTGVQVDILHGSLDRPWQAGACEHAPTEELIGLRNRYRYSPSEAYEHLYLNPRFYTWQCLQGVEQGLCDTDRAHYYRIAERLYLFIWREKIVPTLGLVLIDLDAQRSDGKIFGYADGDFEQVSNFPVSAHCQVLDRLEPGHD